MLLIATPMPMPIAMPRGKRNSGLRLLIKLKAESEGLKAS
jgi:hypothetical protein